MHVILRYIIQLIISQYVWVKVDFKSLTQAMYGSFVVPELDLCLGILAELHVTDPNIVLRLSSTGS